jgi:hypothetical protein
MLRSLTLNVALCGIPLACLLVMPIQSLSPRDARAQAIATELERAQAEWLARHNAGGSARSASEPRRTDPEALAQASGVLDRALARKVWGPGEAQDMRTLVLRLSAHDREAVLMRLVRAVNGRDVLLDPQGQPPL